MKRTPFKAKPPEAGQQHGKKPVKCKAPGCQNRFMRRSMTHRACGPECAAALVAAEKAKQAARAQRDADRAHREALADIKPLSHWLKATERVVNRYVLVRDRLQPCISCGTYDTVQWEAGHFKSVGAHREMRYLAYNIHKQCHHCNVNKSGNLHGYRAGLLARYGQVLLDQIDSPHPLLDHTRESLAEIRREFAAMTRALEKGAANDSSMQEAA